MSVETPKPAAPLDVDRRWLFAIAGVIWTGVGVLLLTYAVTWLEPVSVPLEIELTIAGLAVAAVFVRFVFHGIVRKNITRIQAGPARANAFSFQGWKSYIVTVFMIGLGITLRHSALPKPALAVVYMGVGVALLLTSLLYHRHLFSTWRRTGA
jgi:magnesium-transporting ATPase (P-type)